ncbi:MAG: T9SS type A sorting domain-containing protein [Balneolales bacterium]|nr:T9SS type A sorting domain-containing protein [Balneolales bacterium]
MKKIVFTTLLFVGVTGSINAQFLISSQGQQLVGENTSLFYTIGEVVTTSFSGESANLNSGFVGINGLLLTSGELENLELPDRYHLSQNYPNPFNPSTNIQFTLPRASQVKLQVFNSIGMLVATLIDEQKPAGSYTSTFNASNNASGMYFYRLTVANRVISTKKMILIK